MSQGLDTEILAAELILDAVLLQEAAFDGDLPAVRLALRNIAERSSALRAPTITAVTEEAQAASERLGPRLRAALDRLFFEIDRLGIGKGEGGSPSPCS